uniref:SFRICE_011969 n=1 Tax=Spodoptera frugiperda TaxID=7108 RepID=A0A2H1VRG2_SPOFR
MHDTQIRNNNLWITQRVAACVNRTRYTLPFYHGNRAVNCNNNYEFHYLLLIIFSPKYSFFQTSHEHLINPIQ